MDATRPRHQASEAGVGSWSPPRLYRYRGLAVALLVLYTVYQYMRAGPLASYPYEGTPWHPVLVSLDAAVGYFFIASAFLLALPHARAALSGTATESSRSVLFRRAVRLIPLYVVAILVVWASRNRSFPGDWRDLLEHLTFTQVFDDKRIFYTIGPAWAVAIEVQFCLLFLLLARPFYGRCARVATFRRRLATLAITAAAVGAGSLTWKLAAYFVLDVDDTNWSVWFGLMAKLDIFAVGLLLAVGVATWEARPPTTAHLRAKLALAGGLLLVIGVLSRAWLSVPAFVYFHTIMAVGLGLVLAAVVLGRSPRSPVHRHAAKRVAATGTIAAGLVCYSLYLWHEPVMLLLADHGLFPEPGSPNGFLLGVLILTPLAGVVAWLSYWIIEYPTSMIGRTRRQTGTLRRYYDEV